MTRLRDWPTRWTAYLQATARRGFAAGEHDCVQFVLGAIEALTGARPEVGKYADVAGAVAVCQARGWASLLDACREVLQHEVEPRSAATGDVVWLPFWPRMHAAAWPAELGGLGVFDGAHVLVPGERHLVALPRDVIERRARVAAFRVGQCHN